MTIDLVGIASNLDTANVDVQQKFKRYTAVSCAPRVGAPFPENELVLCLATKHLNIASAAKCLFSLPQYGTSVVEEKKHVVVPVQWLLRMPRKQISPCALTSAFIHAFNYILCVML